jgi:two-component system, NtrC family, response regulator AtoC
MALQPMPEKDILIVDDEADVREVLSAMLETASYIVDTAVTVAEAKALLGEFRYGVVIADWRLPDGDGVLIANLAREIGSHAFVMSGYLRNMLPGNIDPRRTIMKPVKRDDLLAIVRGCIGTARTDRASP